MAAVCENDFDCVDTLICYKDTEWLPASTQSVCACSAYFGWTGNECDTISTHTFVFLLLVYSALALVAMQLAFNLFVVREVLKSSKKFKWDTTNTTLAFISLALLGVGAWRLSTLMVLLAPENLRLRILTSDEKLHYWTPVEKASIAIATVFTLLAALNIVVKWIDVARMSARMLNVPEGLWGTARKKIYAFMILFVLALVGATVGGRMVYATLAALPFMFIIVAAYAYGLFVMNGLLGLLGRNIQQGSTRGSFATGGQLADGSENLAGQRQSTGLAGALRKASVRLPSVRLPGRKASAAVAGEVKQKRRVQRQQKKNNYVVLLNRVRRTAIVVGLASVFTMACLAIYSLPEITKGYKAICEPGKVCYVSLVSDALSLGLIGMLAGLQSFIHENVRSNLEKERQQGSSYHASKGSKETKDESIQPESFTTGAPESFTTGAPEL